MFDWQQADWDCELMLQHIAFRGMACTSFQHNNHVCRAQAISVLLKDSARLQQERTAFASKRKVYAGFSNEQLSKGSLQRTHSADSMERQFSFGNRVRTAQLTQSLFRHAAWHISGIAIAHTVSSLAIRKQSACCYSRPYLPQSAKLTSKVYCCVMLLMDAGGSSNVKILRAAYRHRCPFCKV